MTSAADHYAYRVNWSRDDDEYVATCAEFPSLSVLEPDAAQALQGIRDLVADIITDLQANEEPVPEPHSERSFSGRVLVRMSSDLHRDLVRDADEKNVSLNHLIVETLARGWTQFQPLKDSKRRKTAASSE